MLSDALGMGGEGVDVPDQSDINRSWRSIKRKTKGDMTNPLIGQAQSWLEQLFSGGGPGAWIDEMAANSYGMASSAINEQAAQGGNRIMDMLAARGIMRSSEAGRSLGTLEAQRVNAIQRAAGGIEQQRIQGQMSIPQLAMATGAWGQSEAQRRFGNKMGMYSTAMGQTFNMAQLEQNAAAIQGQQDAAMMGSLGNLGANIGMMAMGMPPMAGSGGMGMGETYQQNRAGGQGVASSAWDAMSSQIPSDWYNWYYRQTAE